MRSLSIHSLACLLTVPAVLAVPVLPVLVGQRTASNGVIMPIGSTLSTVIRGTAASSQVIVTVTETYRSTSIEEVQATVDTTVYVTDQPATSSSSTTTTKTFATANENKVVSEKSTSATSAAHTTAAATGTNSLFSISPKQSSKIASSVTASLSPAEATALSASVLMDGFDIESVNGDLKDFVNPTEKFVDGTIKCSSFPAGQGVISIPWIGYGGWTSIQQSTEGGSTSGVCTDGLYCSYACQAGMSKTQWPAAQPGDLESRGGLLCKNGYLYRTNTASDYLCEWGENLSYAVSKLDKVVSLCRTDYPGSENMNIPTRLMPNSKKPMSVVIEAGYYTWNGGKTSAQYYVNDAGVDVVEGCVWGNASSTIGNWAPVVLGAGYTENKTWLSIIPNPNNEKAPNYDLVIEAEDGATISGDCWYKNGVYSGGPGSKSDGCTAAITGGTANFVFSAVGTAS